MVSRARPRYVDTSNPALAIHCPRCGLVTARFMEFCRNCGYQLWPSGEMATAAFLEWQRADPARRRVSRFSLSLEPAEPPEQGNLVDYDERARVLGIHIFLPYTPYPIVICLGVLILGLSAARLWESEPTWLRIGLAAVGLIVFFYGVFGWVIKEDVRIYPGDDAHLGQDGGEH